MNEWFKNDRSIKVLWREGIRSVPKQDLDNAASWIDFGNHNSADDVVFSDCSVVVV